MGIQDDQLLHLEGALLQEENTDQYAGDGSVDLHGKPVLKRKAGNSRACAFILGSECFERIAYQGIGKNLLHYITSEWHEGNVSAAKDINAWGGMSYLTPLVGAFLADAFWGRYRTIAIFSAVYFTGMCAFILSVLVPALKPGECMGSLCPPATSAQNAIFFGGLYMVALGTGAIKPCISSFGADQFDDTDLHERKQKGSYFNWLFFSLNFGSLISSSLVVWIQENVGWSLGYGIPALCLGISFISFFSGTPLYRFQRPGGSPLTRMCQVIVASFQKHKLGIPQDSSVLYESSDQHSLIEGSHKLRHTEGLQCLDKAAIFSDADMKSGNCYDPWRLCSVTQVEELKILIRILPIWASLIIFSTAWSQTTTMFVAQGMLMDRSVGSFSIPAASLCTINIISVLLFIPVYERFIIPAARKLTGKEKGFSDLQRMGIGLFISILVTTCAALVEIKRLQLAEDLGLVDENVAVPLSILWQIPQFVLVGIGEVFIIVEKMEFFYDQSPDALRSLCSSFAYAVDSMGSYLSVLLLTLVTTITTAGGKPGWIPDNLNKGQLHKFFLLLAALSFWNLVVYVFCAIKYKQKQTRVQS